ncbi:MAG: MATE family efflux transporter [Solobacterium sp.]|nr:MATE family efflux transporter [Solobacterium sp.]
MKKIRLSQFVSDRAFMKKTLFIALPLMIQQLISVCVNLVDNLMVGWLGDAAIASVAAVNRFYMIAMFATNGLASAGGVFIAQFYGAKEAQKMKESFRTILTGACIIMVVFSILGLSASGQILRFFTDDPMVIEDGIRYIRIAAWSFVPAAVTMSSYNAMRAVGETKIPLRCSVTSVLINACLNYILMFGKLGMPRLELRGAALATLIARIIEMVLVLAALKKREFAFKTKVLHVFHISGDILKHVIVRAAPLMMNEILWTAGNAMLFKLYSTRGAVVMSGYSIATTVGDLFFTLFGGMAAATTVLVAQPLGANRLDEARQNGYRLVGFSVFLALFIGILMNLSRGLVPLLYSQISADSRYIATTYLLIQSFMFWNYMATTEFFFILRAGGDTKNTLIMDSFFMWLVNIPVVAAVTYFTDWNFILMYLAGQATDLLKLMFSFHLFRKEQWLVNLTVMQNKSAPQELS